MDFLDLSEVKESSFECLPKGDYVVVVSDAEVRDTKDGQGQYLRVTLEVQEGEFDSRKIFTNFNIKNKNQQAVQIGLGQLKKMMRCAGATSYQLNSAQDLCGLRVMAKVDIKKDEFGENNIVKDFLAVPLYSACATSSDVPF